MGLDRGSSLGDSRQEQMVGPAQKVEPSEVVEATDFADVGRWVPRRRASEGSIQSTVSSASFDNRPPSPNSRVNRVKRLQKLQHLMGERLTDDTLKDAAAPALQAIAQQQPVGPLTPEERLAQIKRTSKLERVFGVVPPTNIQNRPARGRSNSADGPATSIASQYRTTLRRISNHIKTPGAVLDMLDRLSDFELPADDSSLSPSPSGASSGASTPRRNSSFPDPETARHRLIRARNIARTQKLRKFFGGVLNVEAIIDRHIVVDLERSMEADVEDPKELEGLKQDLMELKEELKRRSSDINKELLEAGL
ncbi:hypothetical protein HK104_008053 [Borealophlyctis nickersoniae]|nr:hypothetical protein HK104_008053 [Borealophlyctis nickersoniae]